MASKGIVSERLNLGFLIWLILILSFFVNISYEDEWIKKCDLEFYRSRTVPRSVLPKSFLQALDEAQSSASQAAASVINGKSTVSKNTANKNIIKAKNLGSNKSTAKRSHSLNRNGRTAALGAEESESDDGAGANTAASPPQRPKRLRRQPWSSKTTSTNPAKILWLSSTEKRTILLPLFFFTFFFTKS